MGKKIPPQIESLVKDLKPVKRLRHPALRFALWFGLSFAIVTLALYSMDFLKLRNFAALANPLYSLQLLFGLLSVIATGLAAYCLSVPGLPFKKTLKYIALLPAIAFVSLLFYEMQFLTPASIHPKEGFCGGTIFILSFIVFGLMVWRLRRSFSTEQKWSSFYIALSSAMLPMVLVQVTCVINPLHTLVGHFVPFVFVVFVIFEGAPLVLRKLKIS